MNAYALIPILCSLSLAFNFDFSVKPSRGGRDNVTKSVPFAVGDSCRYHGRFITPKDKYNNCPTRFIHHLYSVTPVGNQFRCGYDKSPSGAQITTVNTLPICPDMLLTDPGLIVVDTLMLNPKDNIFRYYPEYEIPAIPILKYSKQILDQNPAYLNQVRTYGRIFGR